MNKVAFPTKADLNFGNEGDVLHSNKPTVTPPAPTPEDPTITKRYRRPRTFRLN
ncbi:hypothetical protein JG559_08360 [Enterococcus faecalis]|uniref:Uncharacterized protein n=1 Tax=Enterococcus faecalis TaxID=1351 RepID=A0A974NZ28_ENTFL|nr:hypothetical protein JG559_08360 [Enterococcus faecalis]